MKTQITLLLASSLLLVPITQAQRAGGVGGAPRNPPGGGLQPNTPATQPASPLNNSSASGQTSENPETSNVWAEASHILNSDSFSADTENGVFKWNNSTFAIGDNFAVRQRFERYLSSPGFDDTADYQQILQQIRDLLTTNTAANVDDATQGANDPASDKIYQAWQLLYTAAKYSEDAGASETLANQVFNAWRVRDELARNKDQYNQLDLERQKEEFTVATEGANAAANAIDFAKQNPGLTGANPKPGESVGAPGYNQKSANSGPSSNSSNGSNNGSSNSSNSTTVPGYNTNSNSNSNSSGSYTSNGQNGGSGSNSSGMNSGNGATPLNLADLPIPGMANPGSGMSNVTALPTLSKSSVAALQSEELARTYTRQSLLDADATAMGISAKLQYQTQLVTFMAQRRFQHSLIAGMFYEHIFKGSQQRMNVAQSEISKFINTDSIAPSVNNFEFVSHEAINEVDNSMKTVENAYDRGDRWIALQQLQLAFLLGENLPPVQEFDPAKRRVLLSIYTESTALKHMMEIHDFAGAQDKLDKIEADAKDFADADAAPIESAIKEGEQTSNNFVYAAEQAALVGDSDRVTDSLQKATEMWPLNPEISTFSKSLRDHSNMANVGTGKFDDLLARGDDRGIFDARDEIGPAVYQDTVRAAKFKEIVNREMQVEMSVTLAQQALKQNNGFMAWETLMNAASLEPNDPVLARTEVEVETSVAPFVAALHAADQAEKKGDLPASLNYYLQAQDIYPASQICHDAIDRLSLSIMAKLNPGGPSAKTLAEHTAAAAPAAASASVPAS
ncbi:MAG TPA: hypothetical protein VK737_02230 [Opitutales bacterium]|nr:hypothetical protein [Opitutales bacterium]